MALYLEEIKFDGFFPSVHEDNLGPHRDKQKAVTQLIV